MILSSQIVVLQKSSLLRSLLFLSAFFFVVDLSGHLSAPPVRSRGELTCRKDSLIDRACSLDGM